MATKHLLSPAFILLLTYVVNYTAAKYVIRLRSDAQCPTSGYFRDESDCRKFYRCAEHPTSVPGQNYISRSEFICPPGTIFDEALSNCNHIMFVHNIPPGCDVSGAMAGTPIGSGSDSSSSPSPAADLPVSSTMAPSTVPPSDSTTTPAPVTMAPPSGQPPQLPENMQMLPMFPGVGGDQQQQQPPMFPSINLPMMPGVGGDQQQQQPPMFPSINFPMMPGSDQGQQPMFPSVNFPMLPGSQGQQSMIPSVPSLGQNQQSLLSSLLNLPNRLDNRDQRQQQAFLPTSLPSFNLPSVSGSPSLPSLTFPSNLNFQGISMYPNGQQQMNNNHNQNGQNFSPEQNLQNLAGSSSPTAITILAQSNGQNENKPSGIGGWITPQQFQPQQTVVKPTQQGDSNDGWVVPDNFPTFYSAFSGGSPIFLAAHSTNPSSFILI